MYYKKYFVYTIGAYMHYTVNFVYNRLFKLYIFFNLYLLVYFFITQIKYLILKAIKKLPAYAVRGNFKTRLIAGGCAVCSRCYRS